MGDALQTRGVLCNGTTFTGICQLTARRALRVFCTSRGGQTSALKCMLRDREELSKSSTTQDEELVIRATWEMKNHEILREAGRRAEGRKFR
jgi:hypothetical protein